MVFLLLDKIPILAHFRSVDSKLISASLSPKLAPREYKFTSKQGRDRRAKLLAAGLELLREKRPEQVSFADVCQKAEIPRPSAYHFFPNIQAIFLGIRLLHAENTIAEATKAGEKSYSTWMDYLSQLIDVGVEVTFDEPAFAQLIYDYPADYPEARGVGKGLDARLSRLALQGMDTRFILPDWPEREEVFGIALAIVDSIFRLSFRQKGKITDWMKTEAKKAAIAYLKSYLPEFAPSRNSEST